jgi:GNAT superfamily N-acetyltransferase
MNTSIRRARRADADELSRIARAAKRHWGYPASLLRLWQRDLTVTPGFIDRHPVYYAAHRGKVVGFYAISGTGRIRELEHMWVHPRRIGAGVGRALFAHLVRRLQTMRVTRLDVASDPHAEGFYRRMGARRFGKVPSRPEGRTLPLLRVDLRAGGRANERVRPAGNRNRR